MSKPFILTPATSAVNSRDQSRPSGESHCLWYFRESPNTSPTDSSTIHSASGPSKGLPTVGEWNTQLLSSFGRIAPRSLFFTHVCHNSNVSCRSDCSVRALASRRRPEPSRAAQRSRPRGQPSAFQRIKSKCVRKDSISPSFNPDPARFNIKKVGMRVNYHLMQNRSTNARVASIVTKNQRMRSLLWRLLMATT